MWCLLIIIQNALYGKPPTELPVKVVPEQPPTEKINNADFNALLDNVHNFKTLTEDEIEQIKILSEDDKLRVIMQYNIAMDSIQILLQDI